eukprot:TRINITY_DN11622_c0_g1_i1.p1 TRINITY_DN11622_c0_g1~~TRINITY_DN11622_c0_g1_i1.p1  ORF type:complete len:230 (+),score=32.27 TRINITY_DN11622_c0_g1_i1:120-809(+)
MYSLIFNDPVEGSKDKLLQLLKEDLKENGFENTHFSIVCAYILDGELRCHFGLLLEGKNFTVKGQQHEHLLLHHYSKRHRLVAGTGTELFAELCQGITKRQVESLFGIRKKFALLDEDLQKKFAVFKIQSSITSQFSCSKDLETVLNLVCSNLLDGNGKCAKNSFRILSALCDISRNGPTENLKCCNAFLKSFLSSEMMSIPCVLPVLRSKAHLVKTTKTFDLALISRL